MPNPFQSDVQQCLCLLTVLTLLHSIMQAAAVVFFLSLVGIACIFFCKVKITQQYVPKKNFRIKVHK